MDKEAEKLVEQYETEAALNVLESFYEGYKLGRYLAEKHFEKGENEQN